MVKSTIMYISLQMNQFSSQAKTIIEIFVKFLANLFFFIITSTCLSLYMHILLEYIFVYIYRKDNYAGQNEEKINFVK